MKVERKEKAFEPIVITLESQEELLMLQQIVGHSEYYVIANLCSLDQHSIVKPFINTFHNLLKSI